MSSITDHFLIQKALHYTKISKNIFQKNKKTDIMIYLIHKKEEVKSFLYKYNTLYEREELKKKIKRNIINKRINIIVIASKGVYICNENTYKESKQELFVTSVATRQKTITIAMPFMYDKNTAQVKIEKPSIIKSPFSTLIEYLFQRNDGKK